MLVNLAEILDHSQTSGTWRDIQQIKEKLRCRFSTAYPALPRVVHAKGTDCDFKALEIFKELLSKLTWCPHTQSPEKGNCGYIPLVQSIISVCLPIEPLGISSFTADKTLPTEVEYLGHKSARSNVFYQVDFTQPYSYCLEISPACHYLYYHLFIIESGPKA